MLTLTQRPGQRPRTTLTNPHSQLDQHPDTAIIAELTNLCFTLPNVIEKPTAISVPGSRALWLRDGTPIGSRLAFLVGREFAHIHPLPDGSLHLALPQVITQAVIEQGWGEQHPLARSGFIPPTVMMLYAPRDADELAVVFELVQASYHFACGETM